MGRYINKPFLVAAGILVLLSAEIKVNSALTVPMTTEEEYITVGPNLLATTEEEHVTNGTNLLATTEEEYITDGPDLLATTEEEHVTNGTNLLATTEEEYITDGPDLVATTEEEYVTDGPDLLATTEEEHVTNGTNPLPKITEKENTKDSGHAASTSSTKCRDLWIFLIILGILTVLCTILLVLTIALAYQVSDLKARLKKRQTRSNSDFVKAANLWPTGSSQLASEPAETNVTLQEVRPLKAEEEATALKDEEEAKPSKE